jgi:glycosyltransferase involved in cell wall biosynthesis
MELCIVRDPKLGIDFGKVGKLLPYLKEKASVTTYEKLSYRTVKKINRSFTVVNIQYPFHIFKNPFLNHIYFLFLFRRIKIKKIITMHGFVTKESNPLLALFAPAYYRLLNSSKVTVFSELQAKVLHNYRVKNVVVVPHGCDKCYYNFEKDKDAVFFHGFLRKSKGIEILIKSFKKLMIDGYNIRLKILGSVYNGEEIYADKISELMEAEIPNHYSLDIGVHTDEDIQRAAASSYIIVLPYTDKNIEVSGVLHSVMACGTPLIVSNTPRFISELTNNYNALIVEPTEAEITAGIKKLLADKEYWNMLSTNIRRKSEEYMWENVAKQLVNEFNQT